MPCIDRLHRVARGAMLVAATAALLACSSETRRTPPGDPRATATPARPGAAPDAGVRPPREAAVEAPPTETSRAAAARPVRLSAPVANRDGAALRRQAADRIAAANPTLVHRGPVKQPLLAIPVLEVELERDGRIRRIVVLRQPKQALDTTQIAIDAVRRAEPFGDVSALKRPWLFVETFLFGDDRTFKLRSHDE